jgi:hypothetical protein
MDTLGHVVTRRAVACETRDRRGKKSCGWARRNLRLERKNLVHASDQLPERLTGATGSL